MARAGDLDKPIKLPRFNPGAVILRWFKHNLARLAGLLVLIAVWYYFTAYSHLIGPKFLPGPDVVLNSVGGNWPRLWRGTLFSLKLLATGFSIGAILGIASGIVCGWSQKGNYWVGPLVRIIGPIPPLAYSSALIVAFQSTYWSSATMIAINVWFPVTILTKNGIYNSEKAFFDVASLYGADNWFKILRIALPSALPSIFTGLFMGLITAFITLNVAEMLGVRQGLGWYIHGGMPGAYFIALVLYSSLIAVLFKVRDQVLIWQKGLVK